MGLIIVASTFCKFRTAARFMSAALCVCALPALAAESVSPFTASAYAQGAESKGVVVVSVNWGRQWKCGRFDNAQLKSLSFDKVGSSEASKDQAKADLVLEDKTLLPAPTRFVNLAYIAEPGEYQLSAFSVKVAKSTSDVGYSNASRADLLRNGKSSAGSFTVAPGEVVYIGHFFLDCAKDPMPWRYYPSSRDDFDQYLKRVKTDFEALDTSKAKFRLFNTTTLGEPFTLP